MLLDAKTRRDLEIFRTRDGAPGVFDLLNLTRTKGGTGALRFRFENPMSDPAQILLVQKGIRFLAEKGIRFPLQPSMVETVTRYLDSSWDVAVARRLPLLFWIESAVVSLRYRDLYRYAQEGVRTTEELVRGLIPFFERLLERDPPEMVRGLAEECLDLAQQLRGKELGSFRRPSAVFRRDRILRGDRRDEMKRLLDLLSDLDALVAMAEGTGRFGLVFPEVVNAPGFVLEGEGLFHLFLEGPVRNPVRLSEGENLGFLTGPNMAGKTTYLKAVCVSAYLAHVGMAVPASRLRFTPLEAIFTSLAPEENIREGLSYFMAEVRRVREIAEVVAGGMRAFVVFDEVFRGTNVKDAFDASLLVIRGFSGSRNCGFLFSSHLAELADDLESESSVRFTHFDGEIQDGRAVYAYRIKEGVSHQRFGLQLLEEEGVPQLLRTLDPRGGA
ncbi:MAG: MutS-related protein [Longimicrobiales bacterium]